MSSIMCLFQINAIKGPELSFYLSVCPVWPNSICSEIFAWLKKQQHGSNSPWLGQKWRWGLLHNNWGHYGRFLKNAVVNSCVVWSSFIVFHRGSIFEQPYNVLDWNCDFSSSNNIWARFYEFLWRPLKILLGYFYYDRLIGISCMSFLVAILNWNFRLQTSDFRLQISEVPTELLHL